MYRENESSVCETDKKETNSCQFCYCTLSSKLQIVPGKCLKLEKELNMWVEDVDRKRVSSDGGVLCQEALSL